MEIFVWGAWETTIYREQKIELFSVNYTKQKKISFYLHNLMKLWKKYSKNKTFSIR